MSDLKADIEDAAKRLKKVISKIEQLAIDIAFLSKRVSVLGASSEAGAKVVHENWGDEAEQRSLQIGQNGNDGEPYQNMAHAKYWIAGDVVKINDPVAGKAIVANVESVYVSPTGVTTVTAVVDLENSEDTYAITASSECFEWLNRPLDLRNNRNRELPHWSNVDSNLISEWANFIATDMDGERWEYSSDPSIAVSGEWVSNDPAGCAKLDDAQPPSDWTKTKMKINREPTQEQVSAENATDGLGQAANVFLAAKAAIMGQSTSRPPLPEHWPAGEQWPDHEGADFLRYATGVIEALRAELQAVPASS